MAAACLLLVSVKRILIKFWTTSKFVLKQLDYSLSISISRIYFSNCSLNPRVNLFCCFSRCRAPTNSVAPSFFVWTTHNPQFLDSLQQRSNARNVSFRISLRWPIQIMNTVDETKLSCNTPHRRSTTVSLGTYPLYSWMLHCFVILNIWIRRKFDDAAETAFAQKSEEGLDLVLAKCASSNRPLANRIQEMKAHLHQKR